MKKIMIYSKHTDFSSGDILSRIKQNSGIILLFTAFVCGVISGSSFALNTDDITKFAFLTDCILNADIKEYIIASALFFGVIWTFAVCGGLSCFGTLIQTVGIYSSGFAFSVVCASFILSMSLSGLSKFCISVLPGGLLICCALLLFGNTCIKLSNLIGRIVFVSSNEKTEIKTYFIKAGICALLCVIGILINSLFISIFCSI